MSRATFLAAVAAALALAAPADAATYQVSGKQKAIDAEAGLYKMSGGLIGTSTTTTFVEETGTAPYYEPTGTEKFEGCIDRRGDRSCAGDPSGTLSFTFRLWALFGSEDPNSLVWGACWHPVVGGTGSFAGAQGALAVAAAVREARAQERDDHGPPARRPAGRGIPHRGAARARRDGRGPPGRATSGSAAQLADALDAAHRRVLVHRDVKPGNVLLDSEHGREHCYLADFGLTQSASERGPADGQFMGTIDYVSPEQVRGERLDGRADQYGLACLLFECLTGAVPYRRRSDVAAIFAHLEEPVPAASEREAALPAAVDAVLARGMAKRPAERGPTQSRPAPLSPAIRASSASLLAGSGWRTSAAATCGGMGRGPSGIAAGAGAVWVVNTLDGTLSRLDPSTRRVVATIEVGGAPRGVAVGGGAVWVTAHAS